MRGTGPLISRAVRNFRAKSPEGVKMKYGKVPLGKIEAAINKLGGEKGLDRLLAGKSKVVTADNVVNTAKTSRLRLLIRDGDHSAVTLNERHNPGLFYRDRAGLYVSSNFLGKIVSAAVPTEAGKKFKKISRFRLAADATGEQLRSGCPDSVWNATDFCAWLAAKLTNQSNGEEGEFLATGWANLFLVEGINSEVVLVRVHWYSGVRRWSVDTWRLDDTWGAGRRFTSCN